MIEEFEDDAIGLSLERGGGYWYVLLNSTSVVEKNKKSLGSAASERRVTDQVGGTISMVQIRSRSASEGSASSRSHSGSTTVLGVVAGLSFFEQRLQSKTYLLYSSCSLPFLVMKKKLCFCSCFSSRRSSSHLFHNSLFRRRIAHLTTTFANPRFLIFFKSVHSIFNLRAQIYTMKTSFMHLIPTTLTIPPQTIQTPLGPGLLNNHTNSICETDGVVRSVARQ